MSHEHPGLVNRISVLGHDHGVNEIAPWLRQHYDGRECTVTALRGRGWVAEYLGSAAPVQVEGELPTGELFYFRARHDDASLAVGGDDPADIPVWRAEEPCEDASYLPGDRGLEVILRLWGEYRSFTDQARANDDRDCPTSVRQHPRSVPK